MYERKLLEEEKRLLKSQLQLRKIYEKDKLKEILHKISISSEINCIVKCKISLSEIDIVNENDKKNKNKEDMQKETCYETCMYKYFQSAMISFNNVEHNFK